METRANYAIIGVFTLAVIAAAFGFVYWFSGTDSGKNKAAYRVQFSGSVAGLSKGNAVLFNGIRVGEVVDVSFDKSTPDLAFANIEVQPNTPIDRNTRAALSANLLSGAAVVALTGRRSDPPPDPNEKITTLVADQGGFGSLIETASNTAAKANVLLDAVTEVIQHNRGNLDRTLKNVADFSDALGKNAPNIEKALGSIGDAASRIGPLATKLEALTDNVNVLVQAVDRQRVSHIVESVDNVLGTVSDNRGKIADILQDTSTLARQLNDVAPKLGQTIADAGRVVAAIDPVKVSNAIDNTGRFTTALSNSSRDVEATARNANSLTAKLDAAAGRIDGVLKAAENFLGSAAGQEGKSTFASIRDAMERFGRASDNLNQRATDIAQSVRGFAGTGSKQLEGVGVDARRTINDVGRAARNLDRNPSSLIFGGRPSLPEYGGR